MKRSNNYLVYLQSGATASLEEVEQRFVKMGYVPINKQKSLTVNNIVHTESQLEATFGDCYFVRIPYFKED